VTPDVLRCKLIVLKAQPLAKTLHPLSSRNGGGVLKLLKTGVIVASVAACACSGGNTPATGRTESADSRGGPPADQAAAAGRGDSPASPRDAGQWREVTIPAGTELPVLLDTAVASDTSHREQAVEAHLARAVVVHGQTALAEGSRVSGVVTDAAKSGRVKGRARLALRFDSVVPKGDDEHYAVRTTAVSRTAAATKEKDALKIAAPAAGGALIGAFVGGRKGALVGAGVGGGAGTAYVLSTRGEEVRLGRNTELKLRLTEPLTVRVQG
jgi:hypothetical protein